MERSQICPSFSNTQARLRPADSSVSAGSAIQSPKIHIDQEIAVFHMRRPKPSSQNFAHKQVRAYRRRPPRPAWEYRSKLELLGLPLVHLRFNSSAVQRAPVKACIAAGDFAFGLLFAFGGLAIAPVNVGGIAIGFMPWGGAAIGLLAIGGFALGGWVFGGFALGWQAFGGCALAWNAAMDGLAIARDFAVGGVAHAAQANSEIASHFLKTSPFFRLQLAKR
jgi:hypothetical protein